MVRVGLSHPELSMGWVDPRVGSRFFLFLVSWVGSVIAKGLYVNAFKARLDKIWLHLAVKFVYKYVITKL